MPIDIAGGEVNDISGHYRIKRGNNSLELQLENKNSWLSQYSFSLSPKKLSDYKEMCDYQQDSPASHFRTGMLCSIATEMGRITLGNSSLTITENKSKNKITFEDKEKFYFYLKKYFDIEI